jgi:hypothetical protein
MAEFTQGGDAWKKMRLGKVTASRVFSIIDTDSRGKPKAAYDNLMHELAVETITQVPTQVFVNSYMANGTRQEPIARVTYELEYDVDVEQVLFVDHPTIALAGASPDGLVPPNGLIEIKAPQLKTHTEYTLKDIIPPEYYTQIHWQFACMPERKWCDFVSYCDLMPPELMMHVKRIERDDKYVERLEGAVREFIEKLEDLTKRLREKIGNSN